MPKRVYLLGAGATKADFEATPLLDELLSKILYSDTATGSVEKDVIEFLKKFFHNNINEANCPSIQDVLSFLDSCLCDENCYDLDRDFLKRIKNCIILLMSELLEKTLEQPGKGVTLKFVEKLTDTDTVISTNYDIVIDNALGARKPFHYGVQCRRHVTFRFHDFIRGREVSITPDYPSNHRGIPLLKLHGSLNWVYCKRCDELDVSSFEKGAVRCMQRLQRCCNDFCTGFYDPIIISPGHLKVYQNRILKEVWKLAETAISKADELYFVGYSMPHDDYEIKSMVFRGLAKNDKRPGITVIDIREQVGDIYEKLFGQVVYDNRGFESYVQGMSHE